MRDFLIFNFQLIRHTLSPIISPDDKIISPFSIPVFPNLPPGLGKHIVPGYVVRTPDSKYYTNRQYDYRPSRYERQRYHDSPERHT